MIPTGTLEVLCQDSEGTPISGIEVFSWPNQRNFLGGSSYLGSTYPSLSEIQGQLAGRAEDWAFKEYLNNHRYRVTTDDSGIGILRNLPIGRNEYLEVRSGEYRLPRVAGSRWKTFKLENSQVKQLVLTLEKFP
jgi:hypothetical protein